MLLFAGVFLLLRLSLSHPLSSSHAFSPSVHDSSPLLDFSHQVRYRHLYVENKHSDLFVEILSDGTVSVAQTRTLYTVLELKAVKPGHTAIRGVMSSLYLCVNAAGHVFALSVFLDADCSFSEMLQPDGYTHFLSVHHTLPVSLSYRSPSGKHTHSVSRFLPIRTQSLLTHTQEHKDMPRLLIEQDLHSDNPLILTHTHLTSPLFHITH